MSCLRFCPGDLPQWPLSWQAPAQHTAAQELQWALTYLDARSAAPMVEEQSRTPFNPLHVLHALRVCKEKMWLGGHIIRCKRRKSSSKFSLPQTFTVACSTHNTGLCRDRKLLRSISSPISLWRNPNKIVHSSRHGHQIWTDLRRSLKFCPRVPDDGFQLRARNGTWGTYLATIFKQSVKRLVVSWDAMKKKKS